LVMGCRRAHLPRRPFRSLLESLFWDRIRR
jgi:hypothetical protein